MSEPIPDANQDDNDEEAFAENTLIEAIENQIESDNPPAAKATFNKLTLVGYERDEILNLMAHVLAVEIDAILEEDRAFDTQWYEAALRACPSCHPRRNKPATPRARTWPARLRALTTLVRALRPNTAAQGRKSPQRTLDRLHNCGHLKDAVV